MITLLSVASFANIFSHSVGCLFILFMDSYAVQKLLSLVRPHLFVFVLFSLLLGDGSKISAVISVRECYACVVP